ncbi:DUF4837 family protein [Aureitalea marina]|uniref:DUF4837 domain-containing protein n=1 Tax=Aureitalea marina TaxID=930804 RepID=A0A2S7KS66_9FLAO|nr:DUF4837 family protein [Aureitalea marina]PQB05471.1 DUF4837 domain-containing protein [Aureitalea marina]
MVFRNFTLACLAIGMMLSCESSGKRDTSFLQDSVGNINSLQVVMTDALWNGEVGEEVRNYLAAPTDGLPQEEPLYAMNQMAPEIFTDFARINRTFLRVDLGDTDTVMIKKSVYAKPQTGVFITGTSEQKLIELIRENQERIIAAFYITEIKEKQKRIRISKLDIDSLQQRFGLSLDVSSAYRIAQSNEDFYWIRKDLKSSGSTNILVYEVPLDYIGQDSTLITDIIRMRDSIGGSYLPVEDDGRFITEAAYAPLLFSTTLDGRFAYQTKGTWEVKDQYMAGPFVNYAVRDEAKNRYLIIEGFTYAPSMRKRNLQFELEAIIQSAKIE